MNTLYELLIGPVSWLAWGVLVLGVLYRLTYMYALAKKKDVTSIAYMDFYYGSRSILRWIIPFSTIGWQKSPLVTAVTFVFHLCLLATPIFLGAHVMLWDYYWGVSWPTLPDQIADYATVAVIAACAFFGVRRLMIPEVRFVTTWRDWATLILVVSPFLTGFLAYHQIFNYPFMITLHIVCGLAWLAFLPFSRLSHILFFWTNRAYIGSEFGGVRKCKDW